MKAITESYYCDFCGNEICSFPFEPNGILPDGHAWMELTENYQTIIVKGEKTIICRGCCKTLRNAIGLGFVSIDPNIEYTMKHNAGWRQDGNKWIPKSLYDVKKERGLIDD